MKRINPFAAEEEQKCSWFWWGASLGALAALLAWWWLKQKPEKDTALKVEPIVLPDDESEEEPQTFFVQAEEPALAAAESQAAGDDLAVIEGIGPRSAQVLSEAGVTTFAKLAGMDANAIQALLRQAGLRLPYPETWPEQAALAAAGAWEALQALQDRLKGGRKA
jgi:predicted flap endonuclease-1-like 5' DNA nuclease